MATLFELCKQGQLIRVDAALGPEEMDQRCLYLLPKVRDWIESTLQHLVSTWEVETSPIEQLDELLHRFCVGKPLQHGKRYKKLDPRGKHVWELKTGDLRIFGWFPQIDMFVICAIHPTHAVKKHGLYAGFRDEVIRVRAALELDEPKCIEGDDYDDVLSNCA